MALAKLHKVLNKWYARPYLDNTKSTLETWFASGIGSKMLLKQEDLLKSVLPNFFGYHLIFSGYKNLVHSLATSTIRHQVFLELSSVHSQAQAETNIQVQKKSQLSLSPQLQGDIHNLPFHSNSIDMICLQHTLDVEKDPFQVLREAGRVILPNGNLLVLGFNPWSLWGLKRLFLFRSSRSPWITRFISPYRLSEWLNVLDFDVVSCEGAAYLPFSVSETVTLSWMESLARKWLPKNGGFYLLVAKKRVSCVTPLRLKRSRIRRKVLPVAAAGHMIKPNQDC